MKKVKVGLVLGGGGARGLAHIGVLKALQSAGITPDIICGSSMGAFIGAIFAQNPDAQQLEKKVVKFISGPEFKKLGVNNLRQKKQRDPDDIISQMAKRVQRRVILNLAANRIALLKSRRLRFAIESLLTNDTIEDAVIPFACTAADLVSGQEVIFDQGPIRLAVESSSAIPGFIPPVKSNGQLLIDGSVINNFPVNLARKMGADYTILVDVTLDFETHADVRNVVDLVMRSAQITGNQLNNLLKLQADLVIRPDVGHIHWSEFMRINELIKTGADATQAALPLIGENLAKLNSPLRKAFTRRRINKAKDEIL